MVNYHEKTFFFTLFKLTLQKVTFNVFFQRFFLLWGLNFKFEVKNCFRYYFFLSIHHCCVSVRLQRPVVLREEKSRLHFPLEESLCLRPRLGIGAAPCQ